MSRSKPQPDTGARYVIFACSFAIVGLMAVFGYIVAEALVFG
jgi:hypothetical protein